MKLKLTRPLCSIDVEATGTDTAIDRIVSLSIIKLSPEGQQGKFYYVFNPGVTMTEEVIAIHGITNEVASHMVPFKDRALEVHGLLAGCDLLGYNLINFDIPILWEELYRNGIEWDTTGINVIDAGNIFKIKEPRTLEAAVQFYCGRKHEGAHNAEADTLATLDVLQGQLDRYSDLAALDLPALAKASHMDNRLDLAGTVVLDEKGVARYTHKKVRGVAVHQDRGYAEWMLRSGFSAQTKMVLRKLLEEIYTENPAEGTLF